MSISSALRHGEPLADIRQGSLPGSGNQAFATRQFQQFLDDIDDFFNSSSDVTVDIDAKLAGVDTRLNGFAAGINQHIKKLSQSTAGRISALDTQLNSFAAGLNQDIRRVESSLDDYAFLPGRAGGQLLHGGTAATNRLQLQGSSNADLGIVELKSPILIDDDLTTSPQGNVIQWSGDRSPPGGFVGGMIGSSGTVTYSSSTFIWALLIEEKIFRANVNPGFAAFTLFNALARIENEGNFNLVQALVLNAGVVHARRTLGTSTTVQNVGLNFSPQTYATVSGAIMTKTTGDTAVIASPLFSTVAGSTVNLGVTRGLWMQNPNVALFQPQAGIENWGGCVAVEVNALPFGGNVTKRALRSALTAATNTLMIDNTGGAKSDFKNGAIHFNDDTQILFGNGGFVGDIGLSWNGAASTFDFLFASTFDRLAFSSPSADRFLISSNATTANEIEFDFKKFAFGQSGTVGNQVGVFVANARTAGVAGGWADFLLTQAGNLNLGVFAMSDVSAWVINAISFDNSAYTITDLATLRIGGMTTSNPGGTVTNRAGLWARGRSRFEGAIETPPINPAALAAGNNNDWAGLLTGSPNNNGRFWARITGNVVTSVITGIDATAVQDGDTHELTNVGANTINITNQDVASVAANRVITGTGATYVILADETVIIRYDSTTARWRLLAGTGA